MMYVFYEDSPTILPANSTGLEKGAFSRMEFLISLSRMCQIKKTLWKTNLAMEDPPCYSVR